MSSTESPRQFLQKLNEAAAAGQQLPEQREERNLLASSDFKRRIGLTVTVAALSLLSSLSKVEDSLFTSLADESPGNSFSECGGGNACQADVCAGSDAYSCVDSTDVIVSL